MDSSSSIALSACASRRTWTVEEETTALVEGMKDLLLHGWKADNGFKSGYTMVLEKHMGQRFPGTDLKSDPHINSKIKMWKRYYASLSMMQSRSGFGWNDVANTITVQEEDIWSEYVKFDPFAKPMRNKTWPFLKDWIEIFGKDWATGAQAQGFSDAAHDVGNAMQEPEVGDTPDIDMLFDNATFGVDNSSATNGESSSATKRKKPVKRKAHELTDRRRFLDLMEGFLKNTDGHLADLAQRIGFQQDSRKQRMEVFAQLESMGFLNREQKLAAANLLCTNTEKLDLFFSILDDYKATMVEMLLGGRFN